MGLYVDEALGRAAAIVAALTVRAVPEDSDIDWAALPVHSLKGLTAQAGDTALAEEIHDIETALMELRRLPPAGRADPAAAVVGRLREVERALERRAGSSAARDVELEQIAESVSAEARRVAARRGVRVVLDLVVPPDVRVPRRIAGVLVDALGHVARNAVTHGTPAGGAVRIIFERDREALVVVVSDRGDADHTSARPRPDLDSGRGVGLRAAHGRLVAIGGELSVAAGAWGGTSVTIRLPV